MGTLPTKWLQTGFMISLLLGLTLKYPFNAAIWDEVLPIIIFVLYFFFSRFKMIKQLNLGMFKSDIYMFLIAYLLVRTCAAVVQQNGLPEFRFLVFWVVLITSCLIFGDSNFRIWSYTWFLRLGIAFSIFQLILELALRSILGTKFHYYQSIITGPSQFAVITIAILFKILITESRTRNYFLEYIYVSLVSINSVLYESRLTNTILIFFGIVFILQPLISIKTKIFMSLLIYLIPHVPGLLAINTVESSQNTVSRVSETLRVELPSTIKFALDKPRDSDVDRLNHIKCVMKMAEERNLFDLLFGKGTESHKKTIGIECFGAKSSGINRTNTFLAVFADYGLIAFLLIFLIFIQELKNSLIRRKFFPQAFLYLMFMALSISSNLTDSLLFWMILFLFRDGNRKII